MNIYIYVFNISNKYVGLCLMDDKQPVFSIFLVMQSLLGCLLKCAKLYLIDNQLIMKKWCKSKKIYYLFLIFVDKFTIIIGYNLKINKNG